MKKKIKIIGEQIFLRYVTLEDFAEMYAMFEVSRKFYKGLLDTPDTIEKFKTYVERNDSEANECFVICQNADKAIVGAINLSQIFRKSFQNCYLGYYLFEKFTGKGLMTEAVELILRHAFQNLKLHRVEANVQPENLPSIAVLQRNGFTKEGFSRKYLKIGGRWRDHERWAIIKEDWRGKK